MENVLSSGPVVPWLKVLANTQRIRFPWPLSTTRTQPFPSSHYITRLAVCFGLQWRQVLLRHKYIFGSFHVFCCVLFWIPSDILNVFIVSSRNSTALAKCFEDSCWMCSLVIYANTPPDSDFSSLADVKHIYICHNSQRQREKSKKYITPLT